MYIAPLRLEYRLPCCRWHSAVVAFIKALTVGRNHQIYYYYKNKRKSRGPGPLTFFLIAGFLGILFFCMSPNFVLMAKKSISHARKGASILLLDKDSLAFELQTALISKAPECFPIEVSKHDFIGIQYLFCSDEARSRDGQATTISENFSVPSALARRYNFWRRIYSTWSKDQYVMHLAEWPEVILASYDISQAPATLSSKSKERILRKLTSHQKSLYVQLFKKMHHFRDKPEKFSYTMTRLAKSMAHINDDQKYLKAAQKIRIQRGQRDFIEKGLHVAPKYLEAIELEFQSVGVPLELARLAFIESSFNTRAYSKVGASGVYQIMPETGRQYLKIGAGYDERNDPIKAGRAAARILKFYFSITGSWPLAITAYNHGVGGIRRAIASTGSNELSTLVQRYQGPSFGFASKNFYTGYLGMLATLSEKDRLFPELPKIAPLKFRTFKLAKPVYASEIRQRFNCSPEEFLELNLDLSSSIHQNRRVIPSGYVIKVPYKEATFSLTAEQ